MRTLHLIPRLDYGGDAKQLSLLTATHADPSQLHVVVMGRTGPLAEPIAAAGLTVECLNWVHTFDARPLLRLRKLVQDWQPHAIHAWGFSSLRAAFAAARIVSTVFVAPPTPYRARFSVNPFDAWLLRRAQKVIASDRYSQQWYARVRGVDDVVYKTPCVQIGDVATTKPDLAAFQIPSGARIVICVGPLTAHKGHRDAIWALDILKYLYDDLYLVLVGDGPERESLQQFAAAIRVNDRVRFVGVQPDITPWLNASTMAWIPSLTHGGVNAALEAMAAGLPVLASNIPALADIIGDSKRFSPGDKVALARQTHMLLQADARTHRRLAATRSLRSGALAH